jgi:beta-N-acetylhexosaminidase
MSSFDLRRDVGRVLCVGIPGPTLDAATRATLEELHVGGVILFRRNLGSVAEICALTAALHALPSRPFVALDHEGGRVQRVGEPFTPFPPAAAIGRTKDVALAYRVGAAMAAELAAVGVDVDCAPVLDVHSNPANPVIGDRAFASDPQLVAAMGVAMMRGLLDGGMLPCGKHFPGHGDTATDSHHALPSVERARAALERTELLPFRAAIAAGIPILMTAHVLYQALDAERPATLSRRIVTDLLRNELHFDGVVASDDLDMGAITTRQDVATAAVASLAAGCDLLLVCQELPHAVAAFAAIQRAVDDNTLPRAVVQRAAQRVAGLPWERLREVRRPCALPSATHRALVNEILRA